MEKYFRNIFLSVLLLISNAAFGQRIDQRWMMGYESNGGIPFGGTDIVFQSSGLSISYINRPMNFSDASITICDTSNNVLFYSNGIYIANHLNDTMMNGSGLSPSWYTSSTDYYGLTIPQSIIAIPAPGDINRYYLFHNTVDDSIQYSYFLYYSIVDMSLDGGLGAVINKNIILLHDTIVPGRITATKHANGRDWWIVVHCSEISATPNRFYIYLLTPSGLQLSHTQDIGHRFIVTYSQARFSEDGRYYASYGGIDGLHLFNFDRCQGLFSNPQEYSLNDSSNYGGVAFSSNSQFLYACSARYLYQFDLLAANVLNSKSTVAIWDGYFSPSSPLATTFYQGGLAPDNKIYVCCGNSTVDIHVINYPDSAGLACDVCQHCIHLPAYNAFTIPNFPNYYLGAIFGSGCDTLTKIVAEQTKEAIDVFPTPANELCYVKGLKAKSEFSLFNSSGQEIKVEHRWINDEYLELHTQSLLPGVYFIRILNGEEQVIKRIVKI